MQYIPAGKTGGDAFTEALQPYLAMAMQNMLQRRMREQEQPYEIQKALISGGMAQPFTPQMTQQAQPNVPQFPSSMPFLQKAQSQYTRPDFSAGGIPFQYVPSLEREKTQSQIDLNKMISEAYKGGTSGQRVFRDVTTGEEVDEQTALVGMQQGKQYNVFLRTPTRSGVKESKIAEPRKLSEEEVNFISSYEQNKKDLESLITKLTPETQAPSGGFARISTRQRWMVPEKDLRELQEPYTRVVKAFLFGPAGKALTGTEREILEMAASPTGKSSVEWERDLQAGLNVINKKYQYLTTKDLSMSEGQNMYKGQTSSGMGYTVGE